MVALRFSRTMKIAVLSARSGWHTDELQRAIRERGHQPFLFPYESLVARLGAHADALPRLGATAPDLFDCDAVLARIIPNGSLEQIIYRIDALHWLEDAGVTVVNPPRAIERTVDKFYTSALLERAGLATPQTVVCERAEDAAAAFRTMGDVIVKPLFGSMGLGMVRVSDEETAWRVFRALDAIRGVYYLQRAIPHEGRDIRAFVIGDRVAAAIERALAGMAHEHLARRRSARIHAPRGVERHGPPRRARGRRRVCGRGLASRAGWHRLRARGQWHPGMGGTPGRDLVRRRRRGDRSRDRTRGPVSTRESVAAAAQLACLLEASAPKPGNISPGVAFHDTRYEDFLASAAAIAPAFLDAGTQSLGDTILRAVRDTRAWTRANTNLGIVLLLAPLARAAHASSPASLRERVRIVLASTSVADAESAYAAIRLAHPGGLGDVAAQDVASPPTVTLTEAMALAADRDDVAREYATDFARTFSIAVPALEGARATGLEWPDAIVESYLALLADSPDTLIARKLGPDAASEVRTRAQAVRAAGGMRTSAGRQAVAAFDLELRDVQNSRNPGTSADITAAAVFVVLLNGGWHGGWEQ